MTLVVMETYHLPIVFGSKNWSIASSVGCGAMETSSQVESSLQLQVSLPSGRCESISVLRGGTVADLQRAAQGSLRKGFLRLAAADGRLLNPADSLQKAGLQSGDNVAAVAAAKDSCNKGCLCFVVPGM